MEEEEAAAADCDEDVVFKGSPLYHHLRDVGFAELDSAERERYPGERPQEGTETRSQGLVSCFYADCIKRPFTRLLSYVGELGGYTASRGQADSWCRQEVATIIAQGRLLEEDVELLALFAPEVLTWTADPVAKTSATPRPHLTAQGTMGLFEEMSGNSRKLSLWIAVAVAVLTAMAVWGTSLAAVSSLGMLPTVTMVWWSASAGAVAAAVALAVMTQALWRWMDGAQLKRRCVSTGVFAGDCAALTALAKKSLRLVQESEVITRGFTLVNASCSIRTLDLGSGAQLPMLRRSLYWALRSSTLALRDATRGLIASYPFQRATRFAQNRAWDTEQLNAYFTNMKDGRRRYTS